MSETCLKVLRGTFGQRCGRPVAEGHDICKLHLSIHERTERQRAERRAYWDEQNAYHQERYQKEQAHKLARAVLILSLEPVVNALSGGLPVSSKHQDTLLTAWKAYREAHAAVGNPDTPQVTLR